HMFLHVFVVFGTTGSVKTLTVVLLLCVCVCVFQLPHASVDCVECVSSGLLFHQVLSAFFGADAAALLPRCPSLSDIVRLYKQMSSNSPATQTRYIILDRAQCMRDMDFSLLHALLRLQELVFILLSEIVWEKFRPNTGCFEPLLFNFPDYSKGKRLAQILSRDHHPSYTPELYASYINILLGVFFSAALNFSKFCEPLEKGEAKESDIHKLWKNIEPHLQRAMQKVYLREVSSMQWEQQQMDKKATTLRGLSAHAHIELPYYSKFLLIAAYLASLNPARTDRRFFLKTSNHLLGPNVVDSRVKTIASIFSQFCETKQNQCYTVSTDVSGAVRRNKSPTENCCRVLFMTC
uniref:Origin recognition complex, subunit 5 n=1 Tax=Sinocyclocheilus rhinocerous TaxID=307959 RepID=A0A673H6W1_9TELE